MRSKQLLSVLGLLLTTGGVASAGPIGVNGVLGGEWAGVPKVLVTHADGAPVGNFQTPGNTTAGASYSIQVRDDGNYYYVGLQITGNSNDSGGGFANLYFDTDPQNNNGSDVGFEVTNHDYFIAGAPGSYEASPYLTYAVSPNQDVVELAISNSFFTSGPRAGLDYPDGYPTATNDVVLRLSQSFGYSAAGGADYGPTRLGSASVASTPLPSSATAGIVLLGLMGIYQFARRHKRLAV